MRFRRSRWTDAAVAALALTILHTWPLATSPARLSLNYNGDVMLNEWIVAWIQHQLPRAPLDLFQANIFYPTGDALAFSEPLIAPALLAYPVALLGGSPVLVHNVLLLAGFALTMLAAYALAYHWTGDPLASLAGGAAFTFNTQSLIRLEHLQAAQGYPMPLALLAADRLITTAERRHAAWLAVWMVVAAYTSGYLVVFTTLALFVLVAVRAGQWSRRPAQVLGGFAAAALVTALAVLPLYLPYRRVAIEQGMIRTLDGVTQFSATAGGYLASYGRLHDWLWSAGARRDFHEDALFPGVLVLVLAVAGVVACLLPSSGGRHGESRGRSVTATLLVLCAVGFLLSLGTRTPVYGWVYEVFPPMQGLRAAARFGVLFLLGTAMLSALGLAAVRARLPRRVGVAVGVGALMLITAEAWRGPFNYSEFAGIPRVYSLLAGEPGRVVLVEAPFYPPQAVFMNAEYVLNSTAHWRPLMNGYSGYTPATYREYSEVFWYFPDPKVVDAMKAAGATHVMVHPRRFEADADETMRQALANPALERIAVGRDGMTLFRIR